MLKYAQSLSLQVEHLPLPKSHNERPLSPRRRRVAIISRVVGGRQQKALYAFLLFSFCLLLAGCWPFQDSSPPVTPTATPRPGAQANATPNGGQPVGQPGTLNIAG